MLYLFILIVDKYRAFNVLMYFIASQEQWVQKQSQYLIQGRAVGFIA